MQTAIKTSMPVDKVINKATFELITEDRDNPYHLFAVHEYVNGKDIYYIRKTQKLYQ